MRFLFWVFSLSLILQASDSFLSNDEYARMLFKNPRGIACSSCHGERGEGGVLATYTIQQSGEKILKEITAPRINNLDMKQFIKAFERKKRYMPRYYLTDKELAYIYFYLIKQKDKDENQKE